MFTITTIDKYGTLLYHCLHNDNHAALPNHTGVCEPHKEGEEESGNIAIYTRVVLAEFNLSEIYNVDDHCTT